MQFIAFSPDCRVRYNLMFYTGVKLRFSSWFSPDYIESARFRGLTAVNLQATATCNERRVVKSTYISGVGGGFGGNWANARSKTDFLLVLGAGVHKYRHQVTRETTFCTAAPTVFGTSAWNLLHFTILEPKISRFLLDSWTICEIVA